MIKLLRHGLEDFALMLIHHQPSLAPNALVFERYMYKKWSLGLYKGEILAKSQLLENTYEDLIKHV